MANAFSLFGTIGVNTNPLKQGLNEAERELKDFEGSMKSAGSASQTFGKQVDSASPSLNRMRGNLQEIGQSAVEAGAALSAAITLPLVALGGMATKSALDMEKLNAGLTAVMGSAEAASAEFVKLREVAKLPGLGLKEAVQGSVNLQAAGLSADLARRALQSFGNALATVGKGKSELDGVILALTQIQGKGKVAAQEINQIAERVPQIRQVLQSAFGTADTEQLQKLGMTSEQFIGKIIGELEKLPPVATTASGQLENLGDTIDQALLPLGQSITSLIAPAVAMLTPAIEMLNRAFGALPAPLQYVVLAIGAIAAGIGPLLVLAGTLAFSITSITGLMAMFGVTTWAALTPILIIVAKVAAVIAALGAVAYIAYEAYESNFLGIADIVDSVMSTVKSITMDVVRFIDRIIAVGLAVVGALWQQHGDFIMGVLNSVWKVVKIVFDQIRDYIGTVIAIIGKLINGDFAGAWETFKSYVERTWSRIKAIFSTALSAIWEGIKYIIPKLVKLWYDGMTWMWTTIWNVLKKLPGLFLDTMAYVGKALWEGIKALLNLVPQIPGMMLNLGRAIINGIIDGLISGSKFLWDAVKTLIKSTFVGSAEIAKAPMTSIGKAAENSAGQVGFLEGVINNLKASMSGLFTTTQDTADANDDLANTFGGAGGGKSGKGGGAGKSVAQAADEAAQAIASTRMELLLYGKETRLAKFDTEMMAGAYSKWTDAQILFQRWQLFTLDLLDRTTKAIEAKKKAMDSLVESIKKAAEVDMGPIGDKVKGILPQVGPDGGPSIQDRRGPFDLGPMEPPPIAPWDTFFGKVREGMRKLKEELPSFKDQLANTVVGFVDMFGNAFANAVNQWDGTLKGFLNSLASTFRSFIKSVIAELMRLVAIRAATKIFELMGLGVGGAKTPVFNNPFDLRNAVPFGMKASGGLITGPGSGTSDSIPTMLSNGEYVIPAASVRKFGVGFFEALRQGAMPFAMPTAMATAGSQSNQTMNNSFNINVTGGGDAQKTGAMVQREILTALQKTQRRNR